ncbi:hypothetical protein Hanom_Chr11g01006061 [Helianthus anomalus]
MVISLYSMCIYQEATHPFKVSIVYTVTLRKHKIQLFNKGHQPSHVNKIHRITTQLCWTSKTPN